MSRVVFRFYEELNDFLPPERRKVSFEYSFFGNPSVKDLIEALGVPHTEVDFILVNDQPANFSHPVEDGDRIAVYPVFESLDISGLSPLREKPLREPKFILDVHLGKLVRFLRLLGFDSLYESTYTDEEIAGIAEAERGRIVLTRDRGLLKRKSVTHGYFIRKTRPEEQLVEILKRFDLTGNIRPFTVCIACNGSIEKVAKESVLDRLPPKVRERFEEFFQCSACGRIYWPGTHYDRMSAFIQKILQRNARDV